jgi:hypothetical protein
LKPPRVVSLDLQLRPNLFELRNINLFMIERFPDPNEAKPASLHHLPHRAESAFALVRRCRIHHHDRGADPRRQQQSPHLDLFDQPTKRQTM